MKLIGNRLLGWKLILDLMNLTLACRWIILVPNELLLNIEYIIDCAVLLSLRLYCSVEMLKKDCIKIVCIMLSIFRRVEYRTSARETRADIVHRSHGRELPSESEPDMMSRRSRSPKRDRRNLPDLRDVIREQRRNSVHHGPRAKRVRSCSRVQENQRKNGADVLCAAVPRSRRERFAEDFKKANYKKYSSSDLESSAKSVITKYRTEKSSVKQTLLIPPSEISCWGDKNLFSKFAIIKKLVGYTPKMGCREDRDCMETYLDNIMEDGIQDLRVGNWNDFLPMGAPLLDFLAVDLKRIDGWKYPNLITVKKYQQSRGLSRKMLKSVEVREIVIGVTPIDSVLETKEWMLRKYGLDQEIFPSGVVSMDVEEAKLSRHDELRLLGVVDIGDSERIAASELMSADEVLHAAPGERDKWRQVPVRLMVGSDAWVLMITLDLKWSMEKGVYLIKKQSVDKEVIDLIKSIPVCTGLGVRSDVEDIEQFYSRLCGSEVKMKGFIGLETLAVVAGYQLQSMTMTTMGIQVIGTILNKCVSTGDQKWGLKWNLIPDALKIYALGDIKFGHIAFQVLAGIILRDMFPDPEIVCALLSCFQDEAVAWFAEILLDSLRGLEVDPGVISTATTRKLLISSIRGRTSTGKRSDGTPRRAWLWTKLCNEWPSITYGGPRYLIQVRRHFIEQIKQLIELDIHWSGGLEFPRIGNIEELYVGYNVDLEGVNWMDPVPGAKLGLCRVPGSKTALLEFDPKLAFGSFLTRTCNQLRISQKAALREWARLNPDLVSVFIERMRVDDVFSARYANIYDPLRLSAWRSTNEEPPIIQKYEDDLNEKCDAQLEHEFGEMVKTQELAEARLRRWGQLRESKTKGRAVMRARWKQLTLPSLPGWKPKSKRSKRKSVLRGVKRPRCVEPVVSRTVINQDKDSWGSVEDAPDEDLVFLCDDEGQKLDSTRRNFRSPSSSDELMLELDSYINDFE